MQRIGILALLGTAIIYAALPGGANGGRTTNTNVTTIVHDYDSGGAQLLLRSDDYNGSGQATYVSETSGSPSLV